MAVHIATLVLIVPTILNLAGLASGRQKAFGRHLPSPDTRCNFEMAGPPPPISVVVPLLNEVEQVQELVSNLSEVDYPMVEFLLVDDGSTDGTLEALEVVVERLAPEKRRAFRVLSNPSPPSKGKFEPLNRTLRVATGEIVGVLDADSRVSPNVLWCVVQAFEGFGRGSNKGDKPRVIQVLWDYRNRSRNLMTRVIAATSDVTQRVYNNTRLSTELMLPTSGAGEFWDRSTLVELGGWHHSITEDIDLAFRAQLRGHQAHITSHTRVNQLIPDHFSSFVGQQLRWATGFFQTFRKVGRNVLGSNHLSWRAKWDAVAQLTVYSLPALIYLNLLSFTGLALLGELSVVANPPLSWFLLTLVGCLSLGSAVMYLMPVWRLSQWPDYGPEVLPLLAGVSVLGMAMSPFFALSLFQGLLFKSHKFVRTPKVMAQRQGLGRLRPRSAMLTLSYITHIIVLGSTVVYSYLIYTEILFLPVLFYLGSFTLIYLVFLVFSW